MTNKTRCKNRSIYSETRRILRRIVFAVTLIMGGAGLVFQYVNAIVGMNKTLELEASATAERVRWVVASYKNIASGLGTVPEFCMDTVPYKLKQILLDKKAAEYGLVRCRLINANGFSDFDEVYRGDREYFREAMLGKTVISDPIISRIDNRITITVASPVWNGGVFGSSVKSVVFCGLEPDVLNSILQEINISKHSDAYIIGRSGDTVAAKNPVMVLTGNNNITAGEKNKALKKVAEFEQKASKGYCGFQHILKNFTLMCYTCASIDGTPGWSVIVSSPVRDFLNLFYVYFLFIIVVIAVCLYVIFRISDITANKLSAPVRKVAEILTDAADGNFSYQLMDNVYLEEIQKISDASVRIINRLDVVVNGVDSFQHNLSIVDMVNQDTFETFIQNYRNIINSNLLFRDIKGRIIAGEENPDADANVYFENIEINGRNFGIIEISPFPDCKVTDENLEAILKGISTIFKKVLEDSLKRNTKYYLWKEHEKLNVRHLFELESEFSDEIRNWSKMTESFDIKKEKNEIRTDILMYSARAKEIVDKLEEASDFVKSTELSSTFDEKDYRIEDLENDIKDSIYTVFDTSEVSGISVHSLCDDVKVLFGDKKVISKLLAKMVYSIRKKDENSRVELKLKTERKSYAVNLLISLVFDAKKFSKDDVRNLHLLVYSSAGELKTPFEQYIISSIRIIRQMNGSIIVSETDDKISLEITVPQLGVED